jgi:probable rRNA maturation factor
MKLTLTNRHHSRKLALPKWRRIVLRIASIFSKESRYSRFETRELHVTFLNDSEMATANWDFLKHQGPTDILTFDYKNGLAEILISLDTTAKQAKDHDQSFDQELTLYLAHGMLHLAGYNDKTPAQRRQMRQEEQWLLQHLNRKN